MSKLSIIDDLSRLTRIVYEISSYYPESEKYNLTSQIRRAIVSVRLNIREGNVFYNDNKKRFFKIAFGSLVEVDECIEIGRELNYNIYHVTYDNYKSQFWLCFNKLKKLINSTYSDNQIIKEECSNE